VMPDNLALQSKEAADMARRQGELLGPTARQLVTE